MKSINEKIRIICNDVVIKGWKKRKLFLKKDLGMPSNRKIRNIAEKIMFYEK